MGLQERLVDEMKEALRAGHTDKVSVIRLLRAALKNREIERGRAYNLTDTDVMEVILSGIKQRRDSIEQFQKGGRTDLVAKEEREMEILRSYLPPPLSESELDNVVRAAAADVGASTIKDMGKLMKAVLSRVVGRAEGGMVNAAVKRCLEGRSLDP